MRRAPMSRHVCEHGSAIHVFAVKCLGELNSVDHMTLWSLDVQHAKDRWIQVCRLNANIAASSRLGDPGPDDHRRDGQRMHHRGIPRGLLRQPYARRMWIQQLFTDFRS